MTFIDALLGVLATLGAVLTAPAAFSCYATTLIVSGVLVFIVGCVTPHYRRSELWQRLSFIVGGPILMLLAIAIIVWASSSSSPTEWVAG